MEQANPNLRQWLRAAAHRLGLAGFWGWWSAQLAPLVPATPRRALQRRRLRPILAFGRDAVVVWVPAATNGSLAFAETARIALSGDSGAIAQAGRAAIDGLSRIAYGGAVTSVKVVVVLPRDQVLRKTIRLPAAVENDLLPTLAFDADRHTPFKAEDVYFDAAVVGRDPARKEIHVDWAAALKTVVDQTRRRAEAWGATVVGVWPEMPDTAAPSKRSRLNLLPAEDRPDVAEWRRWQIWVPVAAILTMVMVATAFPLWQKRSHARALMQLVEQSHQQANASDALRTQLEQAAGDYNFALQRKFAFPSAMQVLEDVTRLLPDDTWLTQYEIKSQPRAKEPHRDLLLRGESANAGRLVTLLEESKLFDQATPRSPTTKIQPGPGEIFDLGAQLKPLPPPPPVQLAVSTGTAPRTGAAAAATSSGSPTAPPSGSTPAPSTGATQASPGAPPKDAIAAPATPAGGPAPAPGAPEIRAAGAAPPATAGQTAPPVAVPVPPPANPTAATAPGVPGAPLAPPAESEPAPARPGATTARPKEGSGS